MPTVLRGGPYRLLFYFGDRREPVHGEPDLLGVGGQVEAREGAQCLPKARAIVRSRPKLSGRDVTAPGFL